MVQIMIEIVRNVSSLRIEAKEWYPGGVKQDYAKEINTKVNIPEQNGVFNKDNNVEAQHAVVRLDDANEWKIPKRTVKQCVNVKN